MLVSGILIQYGNQRHPIVKRNVPVPIGKKPDANAPLVILTGDKAVLVATMMWPSATHFNPQLHATGTSPPHWTRILETSKRISGTPSRLFEVVCALNPVSNVDGGITWAPAGASVVPAYLIGGLAGRIVVVANMTVGFALSQFPSIAASPGETSTISSVDVLSAS